MTVSLGTQIFWMIVIGMSVGLASNLIFRKRGIPLIPSILMGIAGALVCGLIAAFLNVFIPLAFAVLGSIGFLFISNSFRQKDKPVFAEINSENE